MIEALRTELLAPAKDLACGRTAIDCGADAVYVGAPRFGAREAAGNSLDDIAALVSHAHRYWARVYVTLNTLLRDAEFPEALRLIEDLHGASVDGLIIQDMGLLECDLPPVPLIASTQTHNHTPEKVAFLVKVGFRRVILARELSLDEIRAIREAAPGVELESFVHGALCVGYSGQCYLSYALGGRSGNRGQCAQPCRRPYTLVDGEGRAVERDRHLLSLRDLNLSDNLGALLDAGISSFKVEGRLKDETYVANVVAHYRARLDTELAARGMRKSSSGTSRAGFDPDPGKTFNRGYTKYFLHGRQERIGSPDTPKMVGEALGRVVRAGAKGIEIDTAVELHPGDGLCFFDRDGRLCGTVVNEVRGRSVVPEKPEGLVPGTPVFRNHDHAFLSRLRKSRPERRIDVRLALRTAPGGPIRLEAVDEDGNRAEVSAEGPFAPADKPDAALENIRRQLSKTGDTEFACAELLVEAVPPPFVPVAALNALRRDLLARLTEARAENRPRATGGITPNDAPYPERELSYLGNVLNRRAQAFYRRHGVERIEPAAESGLDLRGRTVMTTRYCVKHQLGLCTHRGGRSEHREPLSLVDENGRRLELRFDCRRCEMDVYLA